MRIFRYWLTVRLDTPFKATYDVIPVTEIDSHTLMFEYVVAAVKKQPGISWEMVHVNPEITESKGDRHESLLKRHT